MPLTARQEAYAQAVATAASRPDTPTLSDCYRATYNVSPDALPESVHQMASRLAAEVNVASRIREIKAAYEAEAVKKRGWDLNRMVENAEINQAGARQANQWGSANGALEIIGRVTGLLTDKQQAPQLAPITRVVVVLNRGKDAEGRPMITEASYEVLPEAKGPEAPEPDSI